LTIDKAVILAAGRGSRMRRVHEDVAITPKQAEVANTGLKAMMPVGRPFIDYVLSGLVESGYRRVCLVIGPGHQVLREHCGQIVGGALDIQFAVQSVPLGTANALASASGFVGDDSFLMINSDNYYPIVALAGLGQMAGSAVAAFTSEGLCRGNIRPERLRQFAIVLPDSHGHVAGLIEKPEDDRWLRSACPVLINMNCWRFTPLIFEACGAISKSARDEYELSDAVSYAIENLSEPFNIFEVDEPVLDLSTQADVAEVTRRLAAVQVRI
jgi:dTDP-glucose pyrophosphorylase